MKKYFSFLITIILLLNIQCIENKNKEIESKVNKPDVAINYSMEDFNKIEKIDTHVHINSEGKTIINFARAHNFKLLNISIDYSEFPPIEAQQIIRRKQLKENPDIIAFSTAIHLDDWDNPSWSHKPIERLENDFELGANSVKTWKNIGMEVKDENGNLIFIDDEKFDSIFKFIKDQNKVLISHAGEPLNCWLPLDSMTVNNDRDYFSKHPNYHMYLHPEMPSYEEQIYHRDNMLAKNLELHFIGAHMASLEWSVDEASKFLDRFPNARLDLAERISHLQYQSQRDHEKVRNFFLKYQDRIVYGTDFTEDEKTIPQDFEKYMMKVWLNDWKYFNTDKIFNVPQLDLPVQGLALPKQVVDKIYRLNAERIFPDAWK